MNVLMLWKLLFGKKKATSNVWIGVMSNWKDWKFNKLVCSQSALLKVKWNWNNYNFMRWWGFTIQLVYHSDLEEDLMEKIKTVLTVSSGFWWDFRDMDSNNYIIKMSIGNFGQQINS